MSKKIKNHSLIIGIIAVTLVGCLWFANYCYGMGLLKGDAINDRGTFGDMFGAVNAVFSGLAFAGIIISLYMQRIDLKNQKEQLELNYEEVKQTNKEFKIQNETLQIQKFENQYYKMIDLHKDNVNEMSIPFFDLLGGAMTSSINKKIESQSPSIILREVEGKKGFVDMFKELNYCLEISNNLLQKDNNFGYEDEDVQSFAYTIFFWGVYSDFSTSKTISLVHQEIVKNRIKELQEEFKTKIYQGKSQFINTRYVPFQGHESRLAHYYRHLFQTVKFVVSQEEKKLISYDEVRQYLRILRAQLSNSEQLILYYNYICGFGKNWDKIGDKNFQFLTRYRMIHNIPIERVKIIESPRNHFKDYITNNCSIEDPLFEWGDYIQNPTPN